MTRKLVSAESNLISPLQAEFNLEYLNSELNYQTLDDRLHFIQGWFRENMNGNLALMSSFGVQSSLLLYYACKARFQLPVVSVDIAGERYRTQRSYRQTLVRLMGLNILAFPAASEADKVAAMDEGLRVNGITATISGIRASQTENRASKRFVEWNERNETLSFHPLLDWPDAKTNSF